MANEPLDLFGEADPSFEKDTAPEFVEHVSFEKRTKFFPWHKPRKQYLRQYQWGTSIDKLVDTLDLKAIGQPLYYLSLPGPDLLDVRALQPIFEKKAVQLSFVGLNGGDDDEKSAAHLNAALLNEVRSLPGIDANSSVVPDLFEHLAKKKSIAYNRIIAERKSFDVINIDLCNSLAEGVSGVKGPNIINALYHLMKHQATSRKDDWLLFLTTRSNKDMVDIGTMRNLVQWLNQLIDEKSLSPDELLKSGLIKSTDLDNGKIDLSKLDEASHTNTFALGIGHWVLTSLFNNNPAWRVDMLPQYGYHVALKDPSCDMLSLGFYCKRLAIPIAADPLGLAIIEQGPGPDIELTREKCHKAIFRRVQESSDVDVKLYFDEATYSRCLNETAQLLASARYDEVEYKKFAEVEDERLSTFLEKSGLVE
jgi:hypothetical protein